MKWTIGTVVVTLAIAGCSAPDPAPPAIDAPPTELAAAPADAPTSEAPPLGGPDAGGAITDTARIGQGESAVPESDTGTFKAGPPVAPPTSNARPLGIEALVNLDVAHNCALGVAPGAFGLRFTLLPASSNVPGPQIADVTKVVADIWDGTGDPSAHAKVYLNDENPQRTVIEWPVVIDYSKYVPFGGLEHFGYRLSGDPTHISKVEYLFGALTSDLLPAPDCVAAELSTSWHTASTTLGYADDAHMPVVFSAQQPSSAGRGTFTIAQLQRRTAPRVDVQYVTTAQSVDVTQLVAGSPLYATGVVTAHVGEEMPAGRRLETVIPWSAGDRWALVVTAWRDVVDGVAAPEPYLVAYYGYPLGRGASPTAARDITN